jgi:hypothetical protein
MTANRQTATDLNDNDATDNDNEQPASNDDEQPIMANQTATDNRASNQQQQ